MTAIRDGRLWFTVFLLGFTLLIAGLTQTLGPTARLVPLRVVLPTAALLVFEVFRDWRRARAGVAAGARPDGAGELEVLSWVLTLPALVYLLGAVIAAPIYAFAYLRWCSGFSRFTATGAALAAWSIAYGAFELLVGTGSFEGRLWTWITP